MATSPEYPDLLWMPPRSWSDANRASVQLVVIHTTEGSARAAAAEDGAAYDQRRTDGTSTHYFHDSDSTIQCVRTADQAHTARAQGNRRGVHHELCTRADSANWADDYHQAMLARVAAQAARDAKKWGIPVRHLTVAQVAAGEKGFCGHVDITKAFPQDKGTHTDPGAAFPWTQFLNRVRAALAPAAVIEEDDMPTAKEIAAEVINELRNTPQTASDTERIWAAKAVDKQLADDFAALRAMLSGLPASVVQQLADADHSDEDVAAALRSVLGDRAAGIGRILAGA